MDNRTSLRLGLLDFFQEVDRTLSVFAASKCSIRNSIQNTVANRMLFPSVAIIQESHSEETSAGKVNRCSSSPNKESVVRNVVI